jgi:outer membrane protein assembly factor BamB
MHMPDLVIHLQLQDDSRRRAWFGAAAWSAYVAGAFCLVVTAIMAASFIRERKPGPLSLEQMPALKQQLVDHPEDEALKERIRRIDLNMRVEYFKRREFLLRGGYLLTGGMVVLAVALKLAYTLGAEPYVPPANLPLRSKQPHLARLTRMAVGCSAVAMAGLLLVVSMAPRYRLPVFALPGEGGDAPAGGVAKEEPVTAEQMEKNWPAFRGYTGMGVVKGEYPTEWDGASGRNIVWKTAIPLVGHNSPVVWEDKVFLAGGTEEQREIYCFDAATGALRWTHAVKGAKAIELLEATGFAPSTMATDGHRVFAIFPTGDVVAVNFVGQRAWTKSLGTPKNGYGHAASLRVFEGKLIVQFDQGTSVKENLSVLYALDGATGNVVWQAKRPVPASWSTPAIGLAASGPQIITTAEPWVIAYEANKGEELWRAKLMAGDVAPSAVFAEGMAVVTNDRAVLAAIKVDGRGDVTGTHVSWKVEDNLPDIVSPLTDGKLVWMVTTPGFITCCNLKTGEMIYEQDLERDVNASPVLAGNRIYLQDIKGVMHIIEAGPEFKWVGKADLGEEVFATGAFAGGRIYIRSKEHLYCIGVVTRPASGPAKQGAGGQ